MFDFYFYYAASLLLRQGQNPYDTQNLLNIFLDIKAPHNLNQLTLGFTYPPYSLWLFFPIAFLNFKYALLAWTGLLFSLLLSSTLLLRKVLNKLYNLNEPLTSILFLTFLFLPILRCLSLGQVSILSLLAIAAFYYLSELSKKNFLSGLMLSLVMIKPHIIAVWLVAVLINSIKLKRFGVVTGFIAGILLQTVCSLMIYPDGWRFFHMNQSHILDSAHLLSHASVIRFIEVLFNTQITWIFIPVTVALIYTTYDTLKNGCDFSKSLMVYLPFSALVAPFGWLHDQVILLPTFLAFMILAFKDNLKIYRTIASVLILLFLSSIYTPRYEFFMCLNTLVIFVCGVVCFNRLKKRLEVIHRRPN
jgi:hypothetical protein